MNKPFQIGAIASNRQDDKTGSILLYWAAIRKEIFNQLDKKGVRYDSTEDAIFKYLTISDKKQVGINIYKIYHFVILAEFSPDKDTEDFIDSYIQMARDCLASLGVLVEFSEFDALYISERLNSYVDDARSSAGCHFKAAERYELLSRLISFFLLCTAALNAFFSIRLLEKAVESTAIGILLSTFAMLTAGLSVLNATNDWKNRLEKHRTAANKYITIKRDAMFLITEISMNKLTTETRDIYFEKAANLKNIINGITQDAPQIPRWAWSAYTSEQSSG